MIYKFIITIIIFGTYYNVNSFELNLQKELYNYDSEDDVKDLFVFSTKKLPEKSTSMPVLSNGHIGFVVFSNSIYLNGVYNGEKGLSHRARIPNYANIQVNSKNFIKLNKWSKNDFDFDIEYSLNVKKGYFKTTYISNYNGGFIVTHYVYAHRYYNRAIINQIFIKRKTFKGDIKIKINQDFGKSSNDIDFETTKNYNLKIKFINNDIKFYKKCGKTMKMEDKELQKDLRNVCILWNHVPEEITLESNKNFITYKFVMTIDEQLEISKQEMIDVFKISNKELITKHINAFTNFWKSFDIQINGNDELGKIIHSSIYSIINSLPSMSTNLKQMDFYGLSPTGLGRGGENLDDYEGHNFWDTETWMFPVILLIEPKWANKLLHYRFLKIKAAEKFAKENGHKGARFPWETAYTGCDVVQPDYPLVSQNQIHISSDISFAIRLYLATTNDMKWLKEEGCRLGIEIAQYWSSRLSFNISTGFYDIKNVMGPDEDHSDVNNNVFTNVGAGYSLYFGDFLSCLCNQTGRNWTEKARKIKFLYNEKLDYHPQYEGYDNTTTIKQADAILLNYPLNVPMKRQTLINDLNIYSKLTRSSGPAMTWSMFAINYLSINDTNHSSFYFKKGYNPYVRDSFYVWNEYSNPNVSGAGNFITGAGGFLQSIINGYGGVRIYLNKIEIVNPQLPSQINEIKISGIKYLGIIFNLITTNDENLIKIIQLDFDRTLEIVIGDKVEILQIREYHFKYKAIIRPVDTIYGTCKIPVENFGKKTKRFRKKF